MLEPACVGTRDGEGIALSGCMDSIRGGGTRGGAGGGARGGGGSTGGRGSAFIAALRESCSRGSSAGSSLTLGTISDKYSKSSEDNAIDECALDVGTAVLLLPNRPRNLDTAEGAGWGL